MKTLKFGIEIELVDSIAEATERFTGFESPRKRAALVIGKLLGTSSSLEYKGTGYNTYTIEDGKGRAWQVMRDGSVGCGGEYSAEVVSPLLDYEDIELVQEIVRALRKSKFKADSSCGIHIHIDNRGMDARQIRNLVNIVSGKEELLYTALKVREFGRERWCRKTNPEFKNQLNTRKPEGLELVRTLWYECSFGRDQDWDEHYNRSRYALLNLHSMWQGHGIEFRCFNGTTHAGEIKSYIQLCLAMVAKAKTVKFAKTTESKGVEKRDMDSFLFNLGLIGDEFKTCRHHLEKHLEGVTSKRSA